MIFNHFRAAFFLAAALPLVAQPSPEFVLAEVVLKQDKFLPAEELLAGIRIVNRSGQTLRLGDEADWISFSIEKVSGGAVKTLAPPPVQGAFDLESTKQATVRVDVAPCYDLRQPGRYLISATVKIKDWNKVLTAKAAAFDIIEGTKLWEQVIGVPRPEGGAHPPEARTYSLQQANYLKDKLSLYLRVSTADGHVIKLINIGSMISFGHPEPMIDNKSRLHLLYQNGARSFAYLVVDHDGNIKIRQAYEYAGTRPRLRLDESGSIGVIGGKRNLTALDVPASAETTTNDVPPKP
jgi:hypothetical protein